MEVLLEMKNWIRQWFDIILLILFLITFLALRFYFYPWFTVRQTSMLPTLENGDVVVVSHVALLVGGIKRGDIIVFHMGSRKDGEYLVKRVIGLPGDRVEIRDGVVYINGNKLCEPYVIYKDHSDYGPVTIPDGKYFVLGDNRPASRDSRYFGPIPISSVIGKVFFRVYPFERFGPIGGFNYEEAACGG